MSSARWQIVWERADGHGPVSPADLCRRAESFLAEDRLVALFLMRRQTDWYGPSPAYVDAATDAALGDADPDCRWQAMVVLAELLAWYPDAAWRVIRQHAEGDDDDLRRAAVDFLLKHLLRRHGARFKPEVDAWTRRSPKFARTYAMRLLGVPVARGA